MAIQTAPSKEREGEVKTRLNEYSPIPDFETKMPFDFESAFGTDIPFSQVTYSEKGATEMALLTSPLVEQDSPSLKEEFMQGNLSGMHFAHEKLSGKTTESRIRS